MPDLSPRDAAILAEMDACTLAVAEAQQVLRADHDAAYRFYDKAIAEAFALRAERLAAVDATYAEELTA